MVTWLGKQLVKRVNRARGCVASDIGRTCHTRKNHFNELVVLKILINCSINGIRISQLEEMSKFMV